MTPTKVLDTDLDNRETVAAGNGDSVQDLPVVVAGHVAFSRWKLSDAERAAVLAGGDILVAVLNYGLPLQPFLLATLSGTVPLDAANLDALSRDLCA